MKVRPTVKVLLFSGHCYNIADSCLTNCLKRLKSPESNPNYIGFDIVTSSDVSFTLHFLPPASSDVILGYGTRVLVLNVVQTIATTTIKLQINTQFTFAFVAFLKELVPHRASFSVLQF